MQTDDAPRFTSPTKGELSFADVVGEIGAFIGECPEDRYKLIVGTDSSQSDDAHFVSVIVMHRMGKCARYFWRRAHEKKMPSLRQRIYHEATLSLALAQELSGAVSEKLNGCLTDGTCQLEVHVDIGQFGPTREMIKEIVGMILGSGFTVKIKPESYAASSVADKHT
jgi:hypothetical protein